MRPFINLTLGNSLHRTVQGESRVGIFVGKHDVPEGEELTIDYQWEALNNETRQPWSTSPPPSSSS